MRQTLFLLFKMLLFYGSSDDSNALFHTDHNMFSIQLVSQKRKRKRKRLYGSHYHFRFLLCYDIILKDDGFVNFMPLDSQSMSKNPQK